MPDPAVWGDVATWVTGALTAGSLWLGFSILRSDRRKEERAQAEAIAIFSEHFIELDRSGKPRDSHWQLHLRVWNHSDRPIFDVALYGLDSNGSRLFQVEERKNANPPDTVILPGESAKMIAPNIRQSENRLHITFSDASRRYWKYNLGVRKLSKLRHRVVKRPSLASGQMIRVRTPRL